MKTPQERNHVNEIAYRRKFLTKTRMYSKMLKEDLLFNNDINSAVISKNEKKTYFVLFIFLHTVCCTLIVYNEKRNSYWD